MLGTSSEIGLETSEVDVQKINCSAPSGIGIPTGSRKRTHQSALLCSPMTHKACVWLARDDCGSPFSSVDVKPLAIPN